MTELYKRFSQSALLFQLNQSANTLHQRSEHMANAYVEGLPYPISDDAPPGPSPGSEQPLDVRCPLPPAPNLPPHSKVLTLIAGRVVCQTIQGAAHALPPPQAHRRTLVPRPSALVRTVAASHTLPATPHSEEATLPVTLRTYIHSIPLAPSCTRPARPPCARTRCWFACSSFSAPSRAPCPCPCPCTSLTLSR